MDHLVPNLPVHGTCNHAVNMAAALQDCIIMEQYGAIGFLLCEAVELCGPVRRMTAQYGTNCLFQKKNELTRLSHKGKTML